MSDSNGESDAPSLSVRLGSLSREQLQALLERLAGDGEAFAQRIEYLIRPTIAVERIATRIRAIRRDDESIRYDGLWEAADLVRRITEKDYPLIATILWRALLNSILERGASRAYHHAADYLSALRRVAGRVNDYRDLPTHAEYEAQVRARHARKTGFWRQVTVRSL